MKSNYLAIALTLIITGSVSADSHQKTTGSRVGIIITDIKATPSQGGGSSFDGVVDDKSDLDELVNIAWGVAWLGIHRGHGPVQNVLEAFLGINHAEMHVYMEEEKLNLAEMCEALTLDPEKLIESLNLSFKPFVEEGVSNSVITAEEAPDWQQKINDAFRKRVYWKGS